MATKAVAIRQARVPRAFIRAFAVRRRRSNKQHVSLGLVLGLAPGVINVVNQSRKYGIQEGMRYATQIYTGFNPADGSFHLFGAASHTSQGLMPLVAGVGLHVLAQKSGVNRMIAKLKLPFGLQI